MLCEGTKRTRISAVSPMHMAMQARTVVRSTPSDSTFIALAGDDGARFKVARLQRLSGRLDLPLSQRLKEDDAAHQAGLHTRARADDSSELRRWNKCMHMHMLHMRRAYSR